MTEAQWYYLSQTLLNLKNRLELSGYKLTKEETVVFQLIEQFVDTH